MENEIHKLFIMLLTIKSNKLLKQFLCRSGNGKCKEIRVFCTISDLTIIFQAEQTCIGSAWQCSESFFDDLQYIFELRDATVA